MSTLNQQIWTDQVMENFYPDTSFLNFARDWSDLVEYDKINLAAAGIDPDVLINNTNYPIGITEREDIPLSLELDKFETENTRVPDAISAELSYDKLESVIYGHRQKLQKTVGIKAAHAYAPDTNTVNTPIIRTTGDTHNGIKRFTPEDILELAELYDNLDVDYDKRFLVLHQSHVNDMIRYDLKAFKDLTNFKEGKPNNFGGFNILRYTQNPVYNSATLQKKPWGAVAEATDSVCSFSFSSDEVMKADGTVKMYSEVDSAQYRATIVGFGKRFLAMPIRKKAIGAIVTARV